MSLKKTRIEKSQLLMFLSLIGFSFSMRFLPHLFNVTPIMAVALLSGFHFKNKSVALFIPLFTMMISDVFIGLHSLMLFTYAPVLISALLGGWMRAKNENKVWPKKESVQYSIIGSLLFFVISNFGVFAYSGIYPHNSFGLIECYSAALPFFERSLVGDLAFTIGLFAIYSFARQSFSTLERRELIHG